MKQSEKMHLIFCDLNNLLPSLDDKEQDDIRMNWNQVKTMIDQA